MWPKWWQGFVRMTRSYYICIIWLKRLLVKYENMRLCLCKWNSKKFNIWTLVKVSSRYFSGPRTKLLFKVRSMTRATRPTPRSPNCRWSRQPLQRTASPRRAPYRIWPKTDPSIISIKTDPLLLSIRTQLLSCKIFFKAPIILTVGTLNPLPPLLTYEGSLYLHSPPPPGPPISKQMGTQFGERAAIKPSYVTFLQ